MAAAAPWMTPPDPAQCQPGAPQCAMPAHRLQRVSRTTGLEAALAQRTEKQRFSGRDYHAINPNCENQDVLCQIHVPLSPFNNPAFLRVVKKSRSTSAKLLLTIEGRATNTKSTGRVSLAWWRRNASRKSRRARFRTTAPPMRLEVITPNRERIPGLDACQLATRHPSGSRCPCSRSLVKSRPCLMREARPKRRRPGR